MTIVGLRGGGELDTHGLPEDPDELTRAVLDADVVLDPLDEEEAAVDPARFHEEIQLYLKDLLKTKKAPPPPDFVEAGRLGDAAYWIYSADLREGGGLYVFVVRDLPITEVFAAEKSASYVDAAAGGKVVDRVLTPAQAALLDYMMQEPLESDLEGADAADR